MVKKVSNKKLFVILIFLISLYTYKICASMSNPGGSGISYSGMVSSGQARGIGTSQFIDRFVNRNLRASLPSATSGRDQWDRRDELDARQYHNLNGVYGRFRTGSTSMYNGARRGVNTPVAEIGRHFQWGQNNGRWGNYAEPNFSASHNN